MVTSKMHEILNGIRDLAPGMNLERFVIYAKESLVAERINSLKGTDYEASLNSSKEGVDLTSVSSKFPPIQVKTCVGTTYSQSAGDCRGNIVRKAQAIHPDAHIALARFNGAVIESLFLGHASLVQDLNTKNISFPMVKRWGFEDLSP